MYPVPIKQYFRPRSVEEARQIAVDANGEFFFVAGGMSLMQAVKSRMIAPDCLIDLNFVDELRGIEVSGKQIRIGAMTRYREVVEDKKKLGPFTALSDAAAHVGDRQVRNRGTLGGSLAWNYISACTPVASLACGATIEILRSSGATDMVPIDDFLQGLMTTALDDGDLLTAIQLQTPDSASGSAYLKWGIVTDALLVIAVGVHLELDSAGKCSTARFAVGGLSSGPARSAAAENQLASGVDVADQAALRACAAAAAEELETHDDPWVSADYKTQLIVQLGTETLIKAAARARA
jgi:carbon-monoxide dehydrogenase medium subunit